jgi:hypothetical protein
VSYHEISHATKLVRGICVIKTDLRHYLSSVYFVSEPVHVSGIFLAHHQEVYCILNIPHFSTTSTNCCIYTVYLLMMGYKYARNMYRLIDCMN